MRLVEQVRIPRPPAAVFRWIEDPRLAARWQRDVASWEITRPSAAVVGTEFRERVGDARGSTELRGRVTAYVPGTLMEFDLRGRGIRVRTRYALAPEGAGTRLRVDSDVRIGGWLSWLVGRLLRRTIARQLHDELALLARLCQGGDEGPAG